MSILARTVAVFLTSAVAGAVTQPQPTPPPTKPAADVERKSADEPPSAAFGPSLEGYEYPFPVKTHTVMVQGQALAMAYMDVPASAEKSSGRTVVLLHGKNFFGAYWEQTARDLAAQGHRVVIPDQIGFGKSSKPENVQYSLHILAENTATLLDELHIAKADIVGHSMGGMLATRFALSYPQRTASLTLVNPIGLEDYRPSVPYQSVAKWYEREIKQNYESMVKYQRESYYNGEWNESYAKWVRPLAAITLSPGYPRVARVNALMYDMIYTQPVCYELGAIKAPTLLIIGQRDRTAIGKDLASPEAKKTMGNFPELGKRTAQEIPGAKLVELDNVGHVPMLEARERFMQALEAFLTAQPPTAPPAPSENTPPTVAPPPKPSQPDVHPSNHRRFPCPTRTKTQLPRSPSRPTPGPPPTPTTPNRSPAVMLDRKVRPGGTRRPGTARPRRSAPETAAASSRTARPITTNRGAGVRSKGSTRTPRAARWARIRAVRRAAAAAWSLRMCMSR